MDLAVEVSHFVDSFAVVDELVVLLFEGFDVEWGVVVDVGVEVREVEFPLHVEDHWVINGISRTFWQIMSLLLL